MSNIFKEKLLREIDEIPEELIPKFYKIFHLLKDEIINIKSINRNSLKGIWNKSIIDEKIIINYHDLDSLAGGWTEEDLQEFNKITADFEKIDKKIWK